MANSVLGTSRFAKPVYFERGISSILIFAAILLSTSIKVMQEAFNLQNADHYRGAQQFVVQ